MVSWRIKLLQIANIPFELPPAPATYSYDLNGNLISDGVRSYVYDIENRLVSASGGATAALVYDPLGRLFQTSGGTPGVTQLLYDGDELALACDSAGRRQVLKVEATEFGLLNGQQRLRPGRDVRPGPELDLCKDMVG